ncbi:MAG: DUF2027 domain-containing protein [Bacteroidales bacterium]|jgi:hypothetical protein|nr:DUF2027 domain-containing protein [Bacteroidales bacterium]MDD4383646.1 DUF2027 domain-containing protein [Bacteroidales bacterium]MDY0197272.1 DUF2027 domain-containing protein [Tenuifilaceae bacterium]
MNCRVGDKVRFLNDVGGGKVTRIEKNTVYVMGEDGFEVPVMASEVIVDSQAIDSLIQQKLLLNPDSKEDNTTVGSSSSKIITNLPEEVDYSKVNFCKDLDQEVDAEGELLGLFIGFVPINQSNKTESDQDLFIINDSPYRLFLTISKWVDNLLRPIYAGFLYSDTKERITTIKKEEINGELILNIQSIFFKNSDFTPQQPEYFDLKLNPTKFYRSGTYSANEFFDEDAMIFSIADTKKEEVLKTLTDKAIGESILQKDGDRKAEKKEVKPLIEEVDLHIDELVDNAKELKAGEILNIQMARFKVALEGAIIAKSRKIVFIHGVGNGKLKHELLKELEKNYPKLRYQDASFREYGYGATMVFIR